ncbi:MAG: hypothetical protein KKC18_04050 [Chloroflexi bacterium]|nr:hypothetical protein [Chloroflexota bacterium]
MKVVTTLLSPIGLLAIFYLGVLFANFSRRLGAVTKMPEHYRWFSIANFFVALAATSQLVRGTVAIASDYYVLPFLLAPWFSMVTFHIPLAIGVTLDLALVWYYWRWILKEEIE